MEPHVFCGPEFVLEVPSHSLQNVLQRVENAPAPLMTSTDAAPAETEPVASSSGQASAAGWTVQPASLLRIQSEIYGVCTAEARRQIHYQLALKGCVAQDVRSAMAMVSRRMANFRRLQLPAGYADGGSGGGSVPPPPSNVAFVEVRPTHSLSSEEVSSLAQSVRLATPSTPSSSAASTAPTYLLLYVTDSRAAAQLHLLCLRNTFLALPDGCRLLNYFVFGGRAAAIVPSQVLQKREVLRSHCNFDAELWGVLEAKLTAEFVEEVRRAGAAHNPQYATGRLLTAFEQHEQDVGAVLHYCEQSVRYAGVCDDDEEASPFLLAMGLCVKLGLTMDDVCRHFARHPRRVIRAIALYLARYTLAPEDYVYFFLPSLTDEVIIACTEDAQVTSSMKELSRQLLTKNDVVDAWLPMLAKYWQDHVVTPAMSFMETCWRLQATQGATTDTAAASATTLFADAEASTKASAEEGEYVGGTGRGVAAAFGFRSVAEIAEHAVQHARVLVPQSMATILKRRRGIEDEVFGGAARAGEGEDVADVLDYAEDDDDFLIHVDVVDADDDGNGEGGSGDVPSAKRTRTDVRGSHATGSAAASASRGGSVTDPHRRIMQAGLKLTLSLLGRRKLFRENVEHYIEF